MMAMLSDALHQLPLLIPPAVIGALAGLLAARRFLSRQLERGAAMPEPDQYTSAALDAMAVEYATAQGRPELADLVSRKLHLLHRLGMRRRWQP
jgi:hypothetical protein